MADLQNTKDQFADQLRDGHLNELRVALYFMLRGAATRIGFVDGRYDIEVRGATATRHVEVKWDKAAAKTGNLYFEVENTRQRQPSGVKATSADMWCHVVGDGSEALLVDVRSLRAFLDTGAFKRVSTGGADSNSSGLLVPREKCDDLKNARWITLPNVDEFFGRVFDLAKRR